MELDELKKIWKDYDEAIEPRLELNKALLKEASVKKVQSYMFEFRLENYLELIINGFVCTYLVKLLVGNFDNSKITFLLIFLIISMGMELVWNMYKLIQADKLSYKRPLLENLKVLEKLRLYNRREIQFLVVLIPVFSAAFLILIPKLFFDLDVFPILGNAIWYFILGSVVVGVLIAGLLSLFPDRKMNQAISFLREISQYEREAN